MKRINYLVIVLAALLPMIACNQVSYKKTKSGLLYKIIPGKGKDSLIKEGQVVKFSYIAKLGDSVMYDSHDKLPGFVKIQPLEKPSYNLLEILPLMKAGDSAVTVQMSDTLMKQMQLPAGTKKGVRLTTTFRIVKVFTNESEAMADYSSEMEKDRPRQEKQRMENVTKEREKIFEEVEKTGEGAKQRKVVEDYLAAHNIKAQRTKMGTYYSVTSPGTGAQAAAGKFVTVKYSGRRLVNDSTFEANTYPGLQLGVGAVITGWDEGLQQFKEGGKGTLYIPGYLAYGKEPRQGSPFGPNEALIFDVEILKVADKPETPQLQPE